MRVIEWQHGYKHAAGLSLSINFLACVELHSMTILPSSHDPVIGLFHCLFIVLKIILFSNLHTIIRCSHLLYHLYIRSIKVLHQIGT